MHHKTKRNETKPNLNYVFLDIWTAVNLKRV